MKAWQIARFLESCHHAQLQASTRQRRLAWCRRSEYGSGAVGPLVAQVIKLAKPIQCGA
ncbi:MAG: hypothetical protein RLZZ511_4336, partial [Cyanobacteriota bacterium]